MLKDTGKLEGDSGPYLQYNYARINSIFRKYSKELPIEIDFSVLQNDIEFELVKELSNFENIVSKALEETSPQIIANYVYNISKKFSFFYHECPVLNADNDSLKIARLALIGCVSQVMKNCLWLLGIDTVQSM